MTVTHQPVRTFRPRAGAAVGGALGLILIALVLSFLAGAGTLALLRDHMATDTADAIAIGVVVLVLVLGALFTVARLSTRLVVDADAGELRREGLARRTERWPLATTAFASRAVRRSTNGVYSGTSRQLLVTPASGATRTIELWRFGSEEFSELMAVLQGPLLPPSSADAAQRPATIDASFALHPQALLRRTVTATVILGLAVIAVVAIIIGVADQSAGGIDAGSAIAVLVLPPLLGLLAIGALVGAAVRRMRRLARSIRVTASSITVDGAPISFSELARIDVTPPSYDAGERSLVLVRAAGRPSTAFSLSGTGAVAARLRDQVFPDYPAFVAALLAATSWREPGFVRYLLG